MVVHSIRMPQLEVGSLGDQQLLGLRLGPMAVAAGVLA
jgi:hypothetical protein